MKKVLSIFLAVIMALSVCVTASAASDTVTLSEKKIITLNRDEEKIYSFKAPQQGIYKLNAGILTGGWADIDVMYNDNIVTSSSVFKADSENEDENILPSDNSCELYFCAEKDSAIDIRTFFDYFGLKSLFEDAEVGQTVKIEITVTKLNAPAAKVGNNTVSKDGDIFFFVPDKSGRYNFRSNTGEGIDPCIEINDINGSLAFNDDNGYNDDYNFDLTVNLEKGKAYAFVCSVYSVDPESEATKGYSFTVSYNRKIDVEQIGLDWYENGEDIIMMRGDSEIYYIGVVPTGATPYSDITVSVGNEKIAEAEYDASDSSIYVQAKRIGKTKITLTDISGVSCEYTVKVLPKFIRSIMEFFDSIRMFFLLVGAGLSVFFNGEWKAV